MLLVGKRVFIEFGNSTAGRPRRPPAHVLSPINLPLVNHTAAPFWYPWVIQARIQLSVGKDTGVNRTAPVYRLLLSDAERAKTKKAAPREAQPFLLVRR
jgi:hypothetical protein